MNIETKIEKHVISEFIPFIVLIPCYNNLNGLLQSLRSIDEEELPNVLIINDGSTEVIPLSIIKENYNGGIILINNSINKGEGATRNLAIQYCLNHNIKYLAHLDAGDFCEQNKFKIQYDFLITNPNIVLVGTWAKAIDLKMNILYEMKYPTTSSDIKREMMHKSVFCNSSIMMDINIFNEIKPYRFGKWYRSGADYELFMRITRKYKTANINKFLFKFVIDPRGLTNTHRILQLFNSIRIILTHFDFSVSGFKGIYLHSRLLVIELIKKYLLGR